MRFKTAILLIITSISLLNAGKVTLALSANVSYAIKDLKKEFNTLYPNIKIQVILGGTGKLVAQIKHNAPYDILMGANMMYPESLYKSGKAITRPLVYAQGSLALIGVKKHDLKQGLSLLTHDSIKKIAVANPRTAPYGVATFEALKNAKLLKKVNSKFVYAESISQTVTYATKVTDLGFIAKSSLFSPKMAHLKKGKDWIEVDPKLYTPINQGIVLLKHGEKSAEASAFYTFILSRRARSIFEKFGYRVP